MHLNLLLLTLLRRKFIAVCTFCKPYSRKFATCSTLSSPDAVPEDAPPVVPSGSVPAALPEGSGWAEDDAPEDAPAAATVLSCE